MRPRGSRDVDETHQVSFCHAASKAVDDELAEVEEKTVAFTEI